MEKIFYNKIIMRSWSLLVLCVPISCELTVGPSDVYGVTGSTVTLHCSTNLSTPVQWEFKRTNHLPDEPWALVYFGHPVSQMTARYRNKNKYAVTVDSTGNEYNLMIYNLQTDDAGTYRCIDDYGFGGHKHDEGIPHHEYRAQVVVLEGDLICSICISGSDINQTTFLIEENYVLKVFCSLTYIGNNGPTLSWILYSELSGDESAQDYPQSVNTERRSGVYKITESAIEINSSDITTYSHVRCYVTEKVNAASLSDDKIIANFSNNILEIIWTSSIQPIRATDRHTAFSDTAMPATITLGLCILFGVLLVAVIFTVLLLIKYIITKRQATKFKRAKMDEAKNLIDNHNAELKELHQKLNDYENRLDLMNQETQTLRESAERKDKEHQKQLNDYKNRSDQKDKELMTCYKNLTETRGDLELKIKEKADLALNLEKLKVSHDKQLTDYKNRIQLMQSEIKPDSITKW